MPQPLCDGVGVGLISLTVVHDFDVKQFFGIFWSLVPYAFLAVLIFGLLFTQRISLLVLVVFGLIITAINEFVVKYVHEEQRPPQSCLDSKGFPSGHAMISSLYLAWLTPEFIVHPNWSIRKKILSIIGLWLVLAPCPPFRHVGGDHSWTQIAGGVVIGVVCGLLLFLFTQFVIVRYLESIMQWRIIKFFHIRNDLRPQYQHSKNHGKKSPSQTTTALPKEARVTSLNVFKIAHIIPILINYILGILGIVLGLVKKHDSECNRSSGPVVIGVGIWTFIGAIFMTAVFLLTLRKMNKKEWYPEVVQVLLFGGGFFLFMAFFWNVAGVSTSTEDDGCRHRALTLGYSVAWFAIQGVLLIFEIEMWYLLDLRRIYGFKKNCVPNPNGKVQLQDKIGDQPGTINHDAPMEFQKGGSDRGVPHQMNAA